MIGESVRVETKTGKIVYEARKLSPKKYVPISKKLNVKFRLKCLTTNGDALASGGTSKKFLKNLLITAPPLPNQHVPAAERARQP